MENNNLEMLEMDKMVVDNVEGFGMNKDLIVLTVGVTLIAVSTSMILHVAIPMVSDLIKTKRKKHNKTTNSEKFQNTINLDKEHYTVD